MPSSRGSSRPRDRARVSGLSCPGRYILYHWHRTGASLVAEMVKNLPAMQGPWVLFLNQEDPLEKGTATHSSILAWKIPWTEEPGVAAVHGVAKHWKRLSN